MSNIRDSLKPYFEGFNELREELGETLKGWDTPVVVVFGPQNAGKSTLLERLAMMSLFPKGEGLCTRVPVRIRLRTGDARPPKLSVWGRREEGEQKLDERAVSAPAISNEITTLMTRLVTETHAGGRAVRADRLIQVESWGPDLPNLDLVDLPGMVVAGKREDAPNLPEQTYDLTLQMIDELKERAIFLAVREASQDVEQSLTTKVLAARPEIRDRCMGALTKCDKSPDETIQEQLTASAEWSLSCGYVATMNKPEAGQTLERLAAAEREWFSRAPARKALLDEGRAGCDQLVKKLTALYHDYLKRSWAPRTLTRLAVAAKERARAREELGPVVSTPPSRGHVQALERLTRQAAEEARERSVAWSVERVQALSPWRAAGAPAWIAAAKERGAEDVTVDAAGFTREGFHPERGLEAWCLGLLEQVVRGFESALEAELQGRLSRDRKGLTPWSELRLGRFPNLVARLVGEQRATVTPMCGRARAHLAAWLGRCLEERVSFEGDAVVVRGGARLLHGALVVFLREVAAWRWEPRWEVLSAEAGLFLDKEQEERARLLGEEEKIKATRARLAGLFPDVKGEAPVAPTPPVEAPRAGEVRCFQAQGAPDVSMAFCPAGEFEMGSPHQ
ncbi:MAG: hypothetical protein FJ138_16815, partial [Deltaproteobacteria bacterium]|nr:hypothetical protein [Deltaproteobacteria bacterium]